MRYLVMFIGHIDERKRPEFFPKEVIDIKTFDVRNKEELIMTVNNYSNAYLVKQAMAVKQDPTSIEDTGSLQTDRMLVPLHMITHITFVVKEIIPGEVLRGLAGGLSEGEPEKPKEILN